MELYAAAALVTVFTVSALGKVRKFAEFTDSLVTFGIYSRHRRVVLAFLTITAEVGCLVLTTIGGGFRFIAPLGLLAVFTATLIYLRWSDGPSASCQCFGSSGAPVGWHITANILLICVASVAMFTSTSAVSAGGQVLGIGIGILSGLIIAALDHLYIALSK